MVSSKWCVLFCFYLCLGGVEQGAPGDDQIGQGEEAVELGRVLHQPAVTDLPVLEEVLDGCSMMVG